MRVNKYVIHLFDFEDDFKDFYFKPKLMSVGLIQWRIQDFPVGGGSANAQVGGANLLFGQIFPENCMKMKEIGPRGGRVSLAPPLDPPM